MEFAPVQGSLLQFLRYASNVRRLLLIAFLLLSTACADTNADDSFGAARTLAELPTTTSPSESADEEDESFDDGSDGSESDENSSEFDEDADGCHDSYEGDCLPVSDVDLDCGDIAEESLDVVGDDVYNLDADSDGIACEPFPETDANEDGCHDSYSPVCVPVDQGDLDCPEIGFEDIYVVDEDTMNLDADFDGVGCEPDAEG